MYDMSQQQHQPQQLLQMPQAVPQSLQQQPSSSGGGISVQLVNQALWRDFHANLTEMIVTKTGRKLFPKLEVLIAGLAPTKIYGIHLRLERADDLKYRFTQSKWSWQRDDDAACFPTPAPIDSNEGFQQTGEFWSSKPIAFDNFKITNSEEEAGKSRSMILVQTLHKYVPVVYVYEMAPGVSYAAPSLTGGCVHMVRLTLAEFVTVTAYQNEKIKTLKTAHNPFAKGCRGHSATQKREPADLPDLQQQQQQRRKRSYSPQAGRHDLLGHRSIEGAPTSKMVSPAFPAHMMAPSPIYATVPPQAQQPTVPTATNPFPSPPQEKTPPTVTPNTVSPFDFPSFPTTSFDGYNPMMMMNPFFYPTMQYPYMAPPPQMDYGMWAGEAHGGSYFQQQPSLQPYSMLGMNPTATPSPGSESTVTSGSTEHELVTLQSPMQRIGLDENPQNHSNPDI